jgi:hypothetical protein
MLARLVNMIWVRIKKIIYKMTHQKLVWYASYGSNLSRERFYLYIKGGPLLGKDRIYPGCTNKSIPLAEKHIRLSYELYFAREAKKTWNGCGVGFIRTEKDESAETYCKMYLITEEQFVDVVKQESDTTDPITINFKVAENSGSLVFRKSGWYNNLIYVGEFDGHPAFTFTNESNNQVPNEPDPGYLKEISKGLKDSFNLNNNTIAKYFSGKKGVEGNLTIEELLRIIS